MIIGLPVAPCRTRLRSRCLFIGAALLAARVFVPSAAAQLTSDRVYYGVNRPIPMTIAVPVDMRGEPTVHLFTHGTPEPIASAPAAPGPVNLAALLPALWQTDKPSALYAQLAVGTTHVGPPVVLVPMISPKTAALVSNADQRVYLYDEAAKKPNIDPKDARIVYYAESAIVFSGYRAAVDQHIVLTTTEGEMEFAMRYDAAPNTARNFVDLVRGGFYTDIPFHRVVPLDRQGKPFVIQVGDPTGTGDGTPGYAIDLEPSTLPHDFGVISMARDTEPNTNGSQVFVCLSREGTARLDGKYCAFGQLVRGEDVVKAIAATPLLEGTDKPQRPPTLKSAKLIPAPPMSDRNSAPTPIP